MNNLYIVSTPIGNLQDITIRAINTLLRVDYILTESVQKTSIMISELAKRYPALTIDENKTNLAVNKPKLLQFNEFIENENLYKYLDLLEKGQDVALVSEAGTPLLSDPGYKLVRAAIDRGINIVEIPGPSAITSSLVVSGLPTDKFIFLGFLPRTGGKKEKLLKIIKEKFSDKQFCPTIIFFESPHRLVETLAALSMTFGDIKIVMARELTKKFEEIIRDRVDNIIEKYKDQRPKGEFTILLNLKKES